jgi:hypothetical protein
MVEPHSTAGRLKIGRSALDKRTNYRGMTANHLTRQVTGFRAFDKDAYKREDDLYDTAMYAALISLGDGTEARWSRRNAKDCDMVGRSYGFGPMQSKVEPIRCS